MTGIYFLLGAFHGAGFAFVTYGVVASNIPARAVGYDLFMISGGMIFTLKCLETCYRRHIAHYFDPAGIVDLSSGKRNRRLTFVEVNRLLDAYSKQIVSPPQTTRKNGENFENFRKFLAQKTIYFRACD